MKWQISKDLDSEQASHEWAKAAYLKFREAILTEDPATFIELASEGKRYMCHAEKPPQNKFGAYITPYSGDHVAKLVVPKRILQLYVEQIEDVLKEID